MHISGLVVTFGSDAALAAAALAKIRAAAPLTLGATHERSWAATLETTDPQSAQAWHNWLVDLPGVEHVAVVFVHWEDAEVADAGV